MSFRPVKRTRLAEQVAASIRDAIVGGDLSPGEPLPSERDLAGQFGVNRSSVREAIHRLEAQGLVQVRQGGATRVSDVLASAGLHLLPWLLAPRGRLDPALLRDVLDLRVMLLGWTAARATPRVDAEQLRRLESLVDRLEASDDAEERQSLDFRFYQHLVELTGNRVLEMLSHAVRRVYRENRDLFLALYRDDRFDVADHREALRAMAAGDASAAAAAMERYGRRAPIG